MKILLRVDDIPPEAGKIQQKKLSIYTANGGITLRIKMLSDISAMITKKDPLMVLNFYFCEGSVSP